MSFGRGNFQPKPRPVLPTEHELRPIAENVFKDRSKMKDYATIGGQPSTESVVIEGTSVPVPYAALVLSHQLGIPHDHPDMPPIVKFKSAHKANDYYLGYGARSVIKWEKDPTYRYIPCYTRYVINDEGTILNAYNGSEVERNVFNGFAKLVADGRSNTLSGVDGLKLSALCKMTLPEKFADFGFRVYSHALLPADAENIRWMPLPAISARSNIEGGITKWANVHELVRCMVRDFNQMIEANKAIRGWSGKGSIICGTYSVLQGDHNDVSAFGPVGGEAQAQDNSFDNDVSF